MSKRGDIWISAALYIAMGVIIISLILSVGLPFINKIKLRNSVQQTKIVMIKMDGLIREVWTEGLGSKRPIFVEIQEGKFAIDDLNDEIKWSIISDDKIGIEPGVDIKEGSLVIRSDKIGQGYEIKLSLNYKENGVIINLKSSENIKQLSGKYNLVIEHASADRCGGEECVLIKEAGS